MDDQRIGLALDLGASAASTRELATALQTVQTVAAQGTAPALKAVDEAAGHVSAGHRQLTQGVLQASFAFQDFTSVLSGGGGLARALASVTNNTQQLLIPLGLLGTGINVAIVSAAALYQNWDKVATLWGKEDTAKEAARMKDLAEATEKARIAAEKLLATPSKEAKQPGGNIQAAIGQFGGAAVRKAIEDALVNAQGDFGPEANKQFTENLLHNVLAGDQRANTFFGDIMRGRGGAVNRKLRGEDPFPGAGAGAIDSKMMEAAEKAQAAADVQRRKDTDANMGQLGRDFQAEQKAGRGALEAGRAVGKAAADQAKAKDRELNQLGREDVQARQQIGRLQEDAHNAKMMLGQGLSSFENTQNIVGQAQAQIAQLQQQLQRIQQRERELQGRQTLLQRGR